MPTHRFGAVFGFGLVACLAGAVPAALTTNNYASADDAAVHELLEGKSGRRESWSTVPALIVMSSVLDYASGDMTHGYVATAGRLSPAELAQLKIELTTALDGLTDGTIKEFSTTLVESTKPGELVRVLRPGQIVVGRFRGVQEQTGNLGYGGRMTRGDGSIASAVIILDVKADQQAARRQLLRTHELGHALGYNHVESRPSVMNPRAASLFTDFDRTAIRAAFGDDFVRH